MAISVGVSCF